MIDPDARRIFVSKIIASHSLQPAQFLQSLIGINQFHLSRRSDMTSFDNASVEQQWSDIQALERRLGESKDGTEAIMPQLRVLFDDPRLQRTKDWREGKTDFQFLH